jgi:hypothetical protein
LRTADLAFDLSSPVALALKRRLFDLLGIFPYDEALTDGFQVRAALFRSYPSLCRLVPMRCLPFVCVQTLRYNASGAYIAHLDWVDGSGAAAAAGATATAGPDSGAKGGGDDKDQESTKGGKNGKPTKDKKGSVVGEGGAHNYDSANSGTNRYATLLVFLNDVPEGGETVFTAVSAATALKSGADKKEAPAGASESADQLALDAPLREVRHPWMLVKRISPPA